MLGKPRKPGEPAAGARASKVEKASEGATSAAPPRKPPVEAAKAAAAPARRPAVAAPAGAAEAAGSARKAPLPPRPGAPAKPAAPPRPAPKRMDSGVRSESLPPPGSEQSTASLSPSLPPPPPRGAPVKPREQLSLSEEELAEELTRSLTAANPHAAANVVRYHQRERVFRLDPMVEHTAVHWSRDGCRVHVRSEAAAEQAARAAARAAREAEEAARLREALGEAEPEPEAEGAAEGEAGASAAPETADAAAGAEGQSDADGGDASAAAAAAAAAAGTPPSSPGEGAPAPPPPAAAAAAPQARFRNQFVYKERGMQTVNNARRDKCCATKPAPKMTFCGDCGRRAIYDWYLQDQRQQERQRALRDALARRSKEAESRGAAGGGAASAPAAAAEAAEAGEDGESPAAGGGGGAGGAESFMAGAAFERSTKLLERMVCQNAFREMADDFKYWDDASDGARAGGEGSLLPLWSFACEAAKRRAVTALAWHPAYDDLFAVGYGSFDFLRPVAGLVALFSLKCPSQPEALLPLPDGGVTSLAFHPQHGALLAVGTHDGSVAVFDVRGACGGGGGAARAGAAARAPLFASNARRGKHDEPVWQLAWAAGEGPGEAGGAQRLAFYSVSGDGRVCLWSMSKSDLSVATIMELRAAPPPALAAAPPLAGPPAGPTEEAMCEEALLASRVGGTCFDFVAPGGGGGGGGGGDGVYIVGTEEGGIHRCSTAYASRYLGNYAGHSMAVYSLRWSPFGGSVFLSASADWSVRLWDARPGGARAPVLSFDLGAAVGDAAWAPHCATAFAAAGVDGRVHFYDLAVNKAEALCAQKVVKKARLTKLAFNGAHPVLLVGDDKGTVLCLKLSPNLRKTGAPAAAHAGGGGAAAAEGEGEGAGGVEAAQRARLHAIVDTALRGAVGAASEVPQQRLSDGSRGAIGMGGREQS